MIDAISLETAHLLGDALPAAHRLRYRIFIERQKYQVPSYRGMEWDQFDTPAAIYLLWRDDALRVRAVARLIPTVLPYMIRELWPHLAPEYDLPARMDVWEVSRLGIDRVLNHEVRARILGEIFCGLAEYGLVNGIREYLCVTPAQIVDHAMLRAGVNVERLGEPTRLGRLPVVAVRLPVSLDGLRRLRRYHRIAGPVLRVAGEVVAQAA
jgi:N-acyl-L-homoserine lactone synthetase